ncbi:MAG: hypothetical protein IK071_08070 [Lachnospiraceae bacterium]|nr:hypothetical protein [Lachnospiraceae bacterium]
MAKRKDSGVGSNVNVGLPSIILLLCVLGLSLFAILTIRAAYNGLKTARTSKKAVEQYYKAEVESDKTRLKIISTFCSCTEKGLDPDQIREALRKIEGVTVDEYGGLSYDTRVNDHSSIRVEMEVCTDDGLYDIHVVSQKLLPDDMEGYSGTGFEIEEIELF